MAGHSLRAGRSLRSRTDGRVPCGTPTPKRCRPDAPAARAASRKPTARHRVARRASMRRRNARKMPLSAKVFPSRARRVPMLSSAKPHRQQAGEPSGPAHFTAFIRCRRKVQSAVFAPLMVSRRYQADDAAADEPRAQALRTFSEKPTPSCVSLFRLATARLRASTEAHSRHENYIITPFRRPQRLQERPSPEQEAPGRPERMPPFPSFLPEITSAREKIL